VPDLEAAVADPAPLVVDSTASTPVYLRPLEAGADFALHSATKFLGGHHDVLLGAVVCRSEDDYERLKELRGRSGIVAAPDPAWLLRRSLETLELRMRRHSENATEIARRLEEHPAVERVRYPGFGGLMSFDVAGGAEAARRVEQSTRSIKNATSLGGTRSVLETRARWEGDRVPDNLIRLSVGLEDPDEIWADLELPEPGGGRGPPRPGGARGGRSPPPAAPPPPRRAGTATGSNWPTRSSSTTRRATSRTRASTRRPSIAATVCRRTTSRPATPRGSPPARTWP
jgi:O-acetylhomoserine/O-acetylserine sulfhydrylase-like pyridoxal-dependent enzyme